MEDLWKTVLACYMFLCIEKWMRLLGFLRRSFDGDLLNDVQVVLLDVREQQLLLLCLDGLRALEEGRLLDKTTSVGMVVQLISIVIRLTIGDVLVWHTDVPVLGFLLLLLLG
jgi:hypothetical protein